MKIYERFLDVFSTMLDHFFEFGKEQCILANKDVQESYKKIENEERFLKILMYLVIEIFSGLKTLFVVGIFLATGALLTGMYSLLVKIHESLIR